MPEVRFLHTSDWQLGMRPLVLDEGRAELFAQARLDAIRRLGQVVTERDCEFVVVAGDVFDKAQLERKTVARALEAMASIPVPVYLLPGNHDPVDPGSIYYSGEFVRRQPSNVTVLDRLGVTTVREGLDLVSAPWPSKRPASDLVAEACRDLEPGSLRILVGHGAVSSLQPDRDSALTIQLEPLVRLIGAGCLHYVALGDRHSVTEVADRIWYSGSPEATDYGETRSGYALVVELSATSCSTEEVPIGAWRFVRERFDVNGADDVQQLRLWFESQPEKARTIVKSALKGAVPLRVKADLDGVLGEAQELFAAVDAWESQSELAVMPDDADFGTLGLSGFAAEALKRLLDEPKSGSPNADVSLDSLALLFRLAGPAK